MLRARDRSAIANDWLRRNETDVARFNDMIDEMKRRDHVDFATLTVAAQELRELISTD